MIVPSYDGACIKNVMVECIKILAGEPVAEWMPRLARDASRLVVVLLDGLGWEQYQDNQASLPTLSTFEAVPITSVAPSTTVSALTSLVTAQPPGIHGIVGYEMLIDGAVFNTLRWSIDGEDARSRVDPQQLQRHPAFSGNDVPVVTRASFLGTAFTEAHLAHTSITGYAVPSALAVDVWELAASHKLVYAYYEGIDTAAHAYGLGDRYSAELFHTDRFMRDLVAGLPSGTTVLVTADHGQVHVGDSLVQLEDDVTSHCWAYSGESRFLWLHAHEGHAGTLQGIARERYGEQAWVLSRDDVIAQGIFGPHITDDARRRLGDVALVAKGTVGFEQPYRRRKKPLICRHGSLTSAEMYVPLLAYRVE